MRSTGGEGPPALSAHRPRAGPCWGWVESPLLGAAPLLIALLIMIALAALALRLRAADLSGFEAVLVGALRLLLSVG